MLLDSCVVNFFFVVVKDGSVLVADDCEPCPRYGECRDGSLECAKGYRVLGRLCVEDGDVVERAKRIVSV